MKKLLTALLAAVLAAAVLGSTVLAEPQLPSAPEQPAAETAGSVPAQTDVWDAMRPAIHALVLAMDENELAYTPDDSTFQWTALYYMLSLYGQMDDRSQLSDEYLTLPAEAVMDYAGALFPDLSQLPDLPEALSDRVSYEEDEGLYHLSRGDEGLCRLELTSSYPTGNTGRVITGRVIYLETGSVLYPFRVRLEESDSMFGCVIDELELD